MPKRSRSGVRKARSSKKRYATRSTKRVKRGVASRSLNVHRFSRYGSETNFPNLAVTTVNSTNGQTPWNFVFTFADLVNYSEFSNLFDQYLITKVVITLRLVNNPDASAAINLTAATNANWYPTIWSIVDYDDSANENIDQLKERIGVRHQVLLPNRFIKFTVRPKLLVQTYRTALSAGYAPKAMYVDMGTPDIPQYGLKTVIDLGTRAAMGTYPFLIQQERKYYFTCKNVR